MGNFYLVQRGAFCKEAFANASLTGCTGIVRLETMCSPQFTDGTIPKAFRRIMRNYDQYEVYSTGINTPDGEELKIFCRMDEAEATIQAIKDFIEVPWKLGDMALLSCVTKGVNLYTDFWWAVDFPAEGIFTDWMAFLSHDEEKFKLAIDNDYTKWWLSMSEHEREKEYAKSLS